ncbi:aspartate/glutamate racemase family protein [Janibacter anophelis]|uniref:aspartate/glutamate racemase family protein n=1 Tax=Janibacter anophelis TaxID=319054 RepID=UPI00082A979C|nr:aspartate/glutamate racemase family protein [Janibacter anophelis]
MHRLGFLHTSPVHVPVFDRLVTLGDADADPRHIVEEALLRDARAQGPRAVRTRVEEHLAALRDEGAEIICCTCSTIGDVAERAAFDVPVFRVDRPMAVRAIELGPRIGVVVALESTIAPTRALLHDAATTAHRRIEESIVIADRAWDSFERGDHDGYLVEIAATARALACRTDVIVLAQASMADAEPLLTDLAVPVLTSPASAVAHMLGL